MNAADLIWYGHCTLWTGDWDWLRKMNTEQPHAIHQPSPAFDKHLRRAYETLGLQPSEARLRQAQSHVTPHCPFCGSVGFQTSREGWIKSIEEWDNGTSPKAPGVRHPGYADMMRWAEKKCFPDHETLGAAWNSRH